MDNLKEYILQNYDIEQNKIFIAYENNKRLLRKLRNKADDLNLREEIRLVLQNLKLIESLLIAECEKIKCSICQYANDQKERNGYYNDMQALYKKADLIKADLIKPIRPLTGYEM